MKSLDNPRDMERFAKQQGLKPMGSHGGHNFYGNENGKIPIPSHGALGKNLQHQIVKQILALVAIAAVVAIWIWASLPGAL